MRNKLRRGIIALAAVAAGATTVVLVNGTAEAQVCLTNSPTPIYNQINGSYLLTLSAGRGFRISGGAGGDGGMTWYRGHGAERPDVEGWVRAGHISC
ncbi:hypothetical protein [Actinokineospora sp.]|uniref:hypothetical protein n=1 Tax=Actinokineospora sp. TaxID=1872133 RepID=UPI0040382439